MSKLAQTTSKYIIFAKFDADGTVEKPDVIGAVFGQTEGLLGPDLELRELQRTGRIGRIDVEMKTVNGKTTGVIIIPSSLDSSETALIAATMETIERVGPCNAKIYVDKVEDVRISKRNYVIDRAKELLTNIFDEGIPDAQEISEKIKESVRSSEIIDFHGLPAGPGIEGYDAIFMVEGRADVVNLLRCGVKNAIAVGGTKIPKAIIDLSKQKVVTVFLDGDRGGDLILKGLLANCDIDFISRAPEGKEVEELTKKEIYKALRECSPIDHIKSDKKYEKKDEKERPGREYRKRGFEPGKAEKIKALINDLTGTRAACFLNGEMETLGKLPVREMFNAMKELNAKILLFDGVIDQKLLNYANQNGITTIVGMKTQPRLRIPSSLQVVTIKDLE